MRINYMLCRDNEEIPVEIEAESGLPGECPEVISVTAADGSRGFVLTMTEEADVLEKLQRAFEEDAAERDWEMRYMR
jgi:hypothetical protein